MLSQNNSYSGTRTLPTNYGWLEDTIKQATARGEECPTDGVWQWQWYKMLECVPCHNVSRGSTGNRFIPQTVSCVMLSHCVTYQQEFLQARPDITPSTQNWSIFHKAETKLVWLICFLLLLVIKKLIPRTTCQLWPVRNWLEPCDSVTGFGSCNCDIMWCDGLVSSDVCAEDINHVSSYVTMSQCLPQQSSIP